MAVGPDCKTQECKTMQEQTRMRFLHGFAFLGFAIRPSGHCFAFVLHFGRFAGGPTCLDDAYNKPMVCCGFRPVRGDGRTGEWASPPPDNKLG